ncbi:MAG: hypothetical protein RLZZ385_1629 [Pseudomonadota bacterium]|jgi:asparagine synthase (glutamine-hydrolysing)
MCGLLGLINGKGDDSLSTWLPAGLQSLHHRGPDEQGQWLSGDGQVRLGHARLSIIDLSPTGAQPRVSPCGRFVIVYNGELYNYVELAAQLRSLGYAFEGESDTEVLLTAYLQWGEACLDHLNGMFAFAIWDAGTDQTPASLFAARDRAGEKPFYYAHKDQTLAFASELKAIPPALRGGISPQGLNHYLALGYIPGDHCLLGGVRKLPPAHAMRFTPGDGRLKVWRWWSLPARSTHTLPAEELLERVQAVLTDAIRIRLRSDVPVGVLLSGGLDSSLIAVLAAQLCSGPLDVFTMALPGSSLDESGYARQVAQHLDARFHRLDLAAPSLSVLDDLAPFVDEPLGDSSLIPAFMISRLTRQHVKVALGGDGGDELFGGYGDYTQALRDQARWGWVPAPLMSSVADAVGHLPAGVRGRNRLQALRRGPYQALIWGSPYFDAPLRNQLIAPELRAQLGDKLLTPELGKLSLFQTGADPIDAMMRTHFGSILPDDFLVKVDRASMANSLELRAPFLDHRLIELAYRSIPSDLKVTRTSGRILQKQLGHNVLPAALDLNRKQGFSIPIDAWFRGDGVGYLDGLETRFDGLLDSRFIRELVAGHQRGRANGSRLFALSMLSIALDRLQAAV